MTPPKDWHSQDWIIVVEALAQWAGTPEDTGARGERAYELIEDIAEEQGLPAAELVLQSDHSPGRAPR